MKKKSSPKSTFSIIVGHLLEQYDYALYGFFAVILAPVFFPASSVYSSQIASFGAFAAGFLMRPVGGIIFGYIGDRYGRKRALLISISLAVLPTLVIGLLPTYDDIGIVAPILLIFSRLIQGISMGGEYSGALIYISEHAQQKRPALKAGMLIGIGYIGAGLGTLIGMFCTLPFMPFWGWRIPFILGGLLGIGIYWLRRNIQETPEFQALSNLNIPSSHPLKKVFSLNKKEFFCCIVFGSTIIQLYLGIVYMNSWFMELGLTRTEILLDNTVIVLCAGLFLPIIGIIADRFGSLKLMTLGALTIVVSSFPVYLYATFDPSWQKYFLLQIFLLFTNACIVVPLTSFLPTLFPSSHRYTGISVGYTLGQSIFGGLTPLFAVLLTSAIGQKWAPSLLLCVSYSLFLICLRLCQKPKLSKPLCTEILKPSILIN